MAASGSSGMLGVAFGASQTPSLRAYRDQLRLVRRPRASYRVEHLLGFFVCGLHLVDTSFSLIRDGRASTSALQGPRLSPRPLPLGCRVTGHGERQLGGTGRWYVVVVSLFITLDSVP